jgi:allantoinase
MLPSERLDYGAIAERPKLVLPQGARLAVWLIVNIGGETFPILSIRR